VGDIVAGKQVPAVGVSLGMERVFAIMEEQEKEKNQVYSSMPLQFPSSRYQVGIAN
jgi:histidyl-tRNA synthetase